MNNSKEKISVYVTKELKNMIEEKSNEMGLSQSSLVTLSLRAFFNGSSQLDVFTVKK